MVRYQNGQVPYSVVSVVLATGTDQNGYWEMRATPATAARWKYAKQLCQQWYGRPIYIRTGWNIYRPLHIQQQARDRACAVKRCNEAAVPGYSSHGGNWNGRDCLAIDVEPNGLSWAQIDKAMVAAGFSAGLITQAISGRPGGEPWHYIDFNAFGPVPAFAGAQPFEEDDMFSDEDRKMLQSVRDAIFFGGKSMHDDGKPLAQSVAEIQDKIGPILRPGPDGVKQPVSLRQEVADAKTGILQLLGRPAAEVKVDIDEAEIAAQLAPLLTDFSRLSDADVKRIAKAAADERDRRERERLG